MTAGKVRRSELATIIRRIDEARPRASLMYARIVMELLDAVDRTLPLSDLSDAIGRGRDSTGVQDAVRRLCDMGIVSREMVTDDVEGGRYYLVRLNR